MNADLQAQLDRIADRLGISRGMTPGATAPRPPVRPMAASTGRSIEILIPGQEIETPHGPCFVREVVYPGSTLRSRYALAACLGQPLDTLAALYPEANLDNFDFARAAFLDTETSGLGGGAGTYAFMIGVGVFEPSSGPPVSQEEASAPAPPAFKVRQFFMRSEREERAVLHALAGVLDAATSLVSFNGRAFDLPLLTNRFIMHRQTPRLTTAPHLDLLHPARRVWRQRLPSCALSSLETQILGLRRDQADVPGWLIPSLYFQYLQTGDAQDLVGVFYHNLEDILSMVTLASTLTRLLADPWAGEDDPRARHGGPGGHLRPGQGGLRRPSAPTAPRSRVRGRTTCDCTPPAGWGNCSSGCSVCPKLRKPGRTGSRTSRAAQTSRIWSPTWSWRSTTSGTPTIARR
ncbi:ribonuclease H-like domain-containing protein [Candidatus Amarolinea dominans]|uniref:ribonuclease H-like domain-containing protein n=1 Tax=Candidatus Amarolinea dominans TaxID=3140696 RepID=UPI001D79777F|nr:ribonuclease H-like domain-containing protein [Anaerolineae bacterium]